MPSPETMFQQCKLIIYNYRSVVVCAHDIDYRFENYSTRVVVDKKQVTLELYDTAGTLAACLCIMATIIVCHLAICLLALYIFSRMILYTCRDAAAHYAFKIPCK